MTARRKTELRSAYDAYVALFWRFCDLPLDHPRRTILAAAVERADAHWRALAALPRQAANGRGDELASAVPELVHS